ATASQYLAEGDYFWNSGMFIWAAQTIIGAFERYLPEVASLFASIDRKYGTCDEQEAVNQAFNLSPSISIDYGIMEKAAQVYVRCVADLGWSDVGSWGALYSLLEKDAAANAVSGADSQFSHAGQNLIKETNPNKKVIIDGLSGYMIADTEDVLMICPLNDENHIKEVIQQANK
ncbi:MAG: sugar phosphate nucleotidyltransferase, partial [Parabacteroides sp.]|nr:sugar phosphate nucleotidyltransferase [Parabacteroides sp.]